VLYEVVFSHSGSRCRLCEPVDNSYTKSEGYWFLFMGAHILSLIAYLTQAFSAVEASADRTLMGYPGTTASDILRLAFLCYTRHERDFILLCFLHLFASYGGCLGFPSDGIFWLTVRFILIIWANVPVR